MKKNQNQQKSIFILLGLYAILLVNSLFLFGLDFNQFFSAYRGALIFHIVLGLLIAIPLFWFLIPHLRIMPHSENKPTVFVGVFIAASIFLTITTGLLLYNENLAAQKTTILWVHIAAVFGTILGFVGHLRFRRKGTFHFYIKPSIANIKRVGFFKNSLLKTGIFGLLVFMIFILAGMPIYENGEIINEEKLKPSFVKIDGKNYLYPTALNNSKSCGENGCHPDIFEQWNESAHHFSSFNNPYYEKSVEVMQASTEVEKIRWCASCHDPMLLLTGDMENAEKDFFKNHPDKNKGLTCLSCHAINGTKDITGNGNFNIKDVGYGALSQTFFGESSALRKAIIQTKPEPHGTSLLSPTLKTNEFCTSCHKVSIPKSVNGYRWKRGQNHYDDWYSSSFSGKHARAFYDRETKSCISCHMPNVPSSDMGNDNGFVKSHRFVAANTALPYVNNHPIQLQKTIDFLQNDIVEVDIFNIKINEKTNTPTDLPKFKKGDKVELEIVVRNKNVGHQFPSGTNDSNEWWLNVKLLDKNGKTILASGEMDKNGNVDKKAHFFRATLIDKNSQLIDKRNVHNWYATVHNSAVPSGISHLVRYEFTVPNDAVFEISAAVQQRKFNNYYNQLTFAGELSESKINAVKEWIINDGKLSKVPKIPITTVSKTQRFFNQNYTTKTALWQRWNNYGIALMQEENYQQAMIAFQKVAELQPKKADGFVNKSRVLLAEGSLFEAEALLTKIKRDFPNNYKIHYFLGLTYFEQGRFGKSAEHWEKVIEKYPEDVVLLSDLGQLYYLMSDYSKSESYLKKALTINPENFTVIYRLMLLYGAMQENDKHQKFKKLYEKYKPNETEEVVIATYKKQHPLMNRETQMVHYHGLD